jgi:hypothetical protein
MDRRFSAVYCGELQFSDIHGMAMKSPCLWTCLPVIVAPQAYPGAKTRRVCRVKRMTCNILQFNIITLFSTGKSCQTETTFSSTIMYEERDVGWHLSSRGFMHYRPPDNFTAFPAVSFLYCCFSLSAFYSPFQTELHDDHFYGDPQYSWDDYIEAWRIVKRGVPERSARKAPQNAYLTGKPSKKRADCSGRTAVDPNLPRPTVSPTLIFDEYYPLTDKNTPPYTPSRQKQCLINSILITSSYC